MSYKIVLVGTEQIDVPSKLILDCPKGIFNKKLMCFKVFLNNFGKSAYFIGILGNYEFRV